MINENEDKARTPDIQYGEATFTDGSKPDFTPPPPPQQKAPFFVWLSPLLGIISLVCCGSFPLGIAAIAVGIYGLTQRKRSVNKIPLIIGIITGALSIIIAIVIIISYITAQSPEFLVDNTEQIANSL